MHDVESRVFALSPKPVPHIIKHEEASVFRTLSWIAPASCDLGGPSAFRVFSDLANWADALHFHYPWPFADLLNLLPAARKPKVLTYHSDIIRQKVLSALYTPLMRLTLRSMDAIVATSPTYAQSSNVIQSHIQKEKLRIIPLGIADITNSLPKLSDTSGIVRKLGLGNTPFVLALGALRYYKGLHTLLEATKETNGRIVIAGDGPEAHNLHSQANAIGATNVIFAGRVSDPEKHDLIRNCRAFVFPSHLRSEAFGMVLLEAAMHSKPLICCDIGSGMSYVNQNNVTGLLLPPNSPRELAKAINTLLFNDELSKKLGTAARERFLSLFSAKALGESYRNLYAEVLKR